jgi:hypothetical protein
LLDRGSYDPAPRLRRGRPGDRTGPTVANSQQNGVRGITARCACNHEAVIPFEKLHPDWYVPDIALRLRCTACGGKRIETYPDWAGDWRSSSD